MIDIENDVFGVIAAALRGEHPGVYVASEYVNRPPNFPAVTIIENDNRVVSRYRTSGKLENASSVMYEVNVYSNKTKGKKSEAKAIADTLDIAFASIGFTRIMRNQVLNLNDATIYRIVCRYEGVVIPNDDGNYYIYSN